MKLPEISPWFITGIPTYLKLLVQYPSITRATQHYRREVHESSWNYYTDASMLPELPTFEVSTQLTAKLDDDYVTKMRRYKEQSIEHVAIPEQISVFVREIY